MLVEQPLHLNHFANPKTNTVVIVKKKVLYADDDLDDKAWIEEACHAEAESLEIDFVENGRQALEYLQTHTDATPSLIVLDLNMPGLDGRQTLQKLKADERFSEIPVAIVTTSTSRMDMEVCKRLGAEIFLTKPDTIAEWQQVIRQLLPLVYS